MITKAAVSAIVLALTLLPCLLPGQTPVRPPYLDQRFDEDWSFLKDPARRGDPWDSWKFISFGENAPNSYLSIGGEARLRWDFYRNEWWHYQLFNARARYPVLSDTVLSVPMMDSSRA